MITRLIRIFTIKWWCLHFQPEISFLGKFGTKNNCNKQNSIAHFFCFPLEIPFLSKFDPKNKDCQFNLKFGTCTNSSMENSMLMFTFFVFKQKYPFWANLIAKFKIDCLKWNWVPRLIRILTITWWCLHFRLEIPFLGKFGPKNQNCQFKLKFDT